MTNKEVANKFLDGHDAHTANLTSDCGKLFSYNTCIAQWDVDSSGEYSRNIVIGNATKYSVTTSKHMSYIRFGVDIWTTKEVPIGTHDLRRYL